MEITSQLVSRVALTGFSGKFLLQLSNLLAGLVCNILQDHKQESVTHKEPWVAACKLTQRLGARA